MTNYRKLILDIIMSSMEHLTADEIFMKAKKTQPSIAVGTVYRNLGLMVETGEIRRIVIPNSPDRYDKTVQQHEHALCQKCGELSDVCIPDLKDYLEKQTGIAVLGYDLNLRYICDKCKESENKVQ